MCADETDRLGDRQTGRLEDSTAAHVPERRLTVREIRCSHSKRLTDWFIHDEGTGRLGYSPAARVPTKAVRTRPEKKNGDKEREQWAGGVDVLVIKFTNFSISGKRDLD